MNDPLPHHHWTMLLRIQVSLICTYQCENILHNIDFPVSVHVYVSPALWGQYMKVWKVYFLQPVSNLHVGEPSQYLLRHTCAKVYLCKPCKWQSHLHNIVWVPSHVSLNTHTMYNPCILDLKRQCLWQYIYIATVSVPPKTR